MLRNNSESLMTILEVFVHDPLHRWTLTVEEASKKQRDEHDDGVGGGGQRAAAAAAAAAVAAEEDSEEGEYASSGHWVKDANRILERVRVKTQGLEDHSGEALSVAGQVAHLISVARDPAQLSKMYHGWAAFV